VEVHDSPARSSSLRACLSGGAADGRRGVLKGLISKSIGI
jgi:hypothetical protein